MNDDAIEIIEVDELDLVLEPHAWSFGERYVREIDDCWQRLAAKNPSQFNGPVLIMHRWSFDRKADGQLVLRGAFLQTDYKTFVAWRDLSLPDEGARNCFSMAALRSSDGLFLLGEMNTFTTLPGRLQFPAGTPDPNDVRDNRVDLEASAFRELEEETGLTHQDVTAAPGWSLVMEGRKIACMKRMLVDAPAKDVTARVLRTLTVQTEPELAALHAIKAPTQREIARMPGFMRAYLHYILENSY